MASIDVSKLSIEELKELHSLVEKKMRDSRKSQLESFVKSLMEEGASKGFSVSEVVSAIVNNADTKVRISRKNKAERKRIVHPENPSISWNGLGRRPKWLSKVANYEDEST
ncbi:H-NS family nucleoid-associated regulatory protein [Thioclava kandeliae]|uniref:H-NS family nucleoid-associated regulatory protein n=1 Tax=Thioclava kandeliae TaxID=3070818 RepID=A0ABV1SMG6_9RHOB